MLRKVLNSLSLAGLLLWITGLWLGFVGYLAGYFISLVFFNAPTHRAEPIYLYLAGSLLSYPLFALVGFFGSGGLWHMNNPEHWRRHLAFLPLIPITAIMIIWLATAK